MLKRKLISLAAVFIAYMLFSSCTSNGSAATADNTTADNATIENISTNEPIIETADNATIGNEALLINMLANIKAGDIISLTEYSGISAEELAVLLNKVPDLIVEHEPFDFSNAWIWSIFARFDRRYDSNNNLGVRAGLEENIVEISYNGIRIHSNSPKLYWLIRSIYDTEAEIDEAALARFKDVLNARMESELAYYKDTAPKSELYGYELNRLVLKSTFDDIVDGKVYIYEYDYSLLMKKPEYAFIAGGIYLPKNVYI